jgi:hypothetical protein
MVRSAPDQSLDEIFWRYRTTETGYYCQGAGAPVTSEHINKGLTMAKAPTAVKTASVLAFERKLATSDAVMYSGSWQGNQWQPFAFRKKRCVAPSLTV